MKANITDTLVHIIIYIQHCYKKKSTLLYFTFPWAIKVNFTLLDYGVVNFVQKTVIFVLQLLERDGKRNVYIPGVRKVFFKRHEIKYVYFI